MVPHLRVTRILILALSYPLPSRRKDTRDRRCVRSVVATGEPRPAVTMVPPGKRARATRQPRGGASLPPRRQFSDAGHPPLMSNSPRQRIVLALCLLLLGVLLLTVPLRTERERNHHRINARIEVTVTTGDLRLALSRQPSLQFSSTPPQLPTININDTMRYQVFKGVGAAMTDSSAWLLHNQLSPSTRDHVMEALFGHTGIGVAFLRVPMGASDFTATRTPYAYDDMPLGQSDPGLKHFSIAHDQAYILPLLREAERLDPDVYVLANPWSPPGWMKATVAWTTFCTAAGCFQTLYLSWPGTSSNSSPPTAGRAFVSMPSRPRTSLATRQVIPVLSSVSPRRRILFARTSRRL